MEQFLRNGSSKIFSQKLNVFTYHSDISLILINVDNIEIFQRPDESVSVVALNT